MILERSSGIAIPESESSKFWVSCICQQLTRSSRSFENPDVTVSTEYFERKNGFIKIPRLYKINNDEIEFEDRFTYGEDIDIEFYENEQNLNVYLSDFTKKYFISCSKSLHFAKSFLTFFVFSLSIFNIFKQYSLFSFISLYRF